MKYFDVELSSEAKDQLEKMSDADRKLFEEIIQKARRNPFGIARSTKTGIPWLFDTIGLKLRWLLREIQLFFVK